VLVLVAMLAWAGAATAQLPYSDGFEGYAVGAYPTPRWANLFDGYSASVSDATAYSGTKSFRIESYPTWARWDYISIGTIPDEIGFRGAVRVETAGRGGALGFGFLQPGTTNTGRGANCIAFGNDGVIYWYTRTAGNAAVGNWTPGQWVVVGAQINYVTQLANVFVNDLLVVSGVPTDPKIIPASVYGSEVPLDQLAFWGENFGGSDTGVMFLDDLVVGDPTVDAKPTSWSRVKQLYR
jgi:hypothetical protein